MRILVTGFEAFGGESVNPALIALTHLPERVNGAEVVKLPLPVTYTGSRRLVQNALATLQPDAVLCVGQAAGRSAVTPEKQAFNRVSQKTADSDGMIPPGPQLMPGEAECLPSTLPLAALISQLEVEGIPAALSESAGDYVCNSVMYSLLHWLKQHDLHIPGGFLHVPLNCQQAAARGKGEPALTQEQIDRAVFTCVKVIAAHEKKD